MTCQHKRIQTWSVEDTGEVMTWSCADCGRRFEPSHQRLRDFVLTNDQFALCQWDEAVGEWVPVPYSAVERALGK